MKNEINFEEANNKCRAFFDEVAKELSEVYTVVGSCNKDISAYLIPFGTEREITYYSKPDSSFRVSDHWNWYSNLKKCNIEDYIQCESVDMPVPRERQVPGKASFPRKGSQVCLMFPDGKYHCIYGYSYDRRKREWKWIENTPKAAAKMALEFRKIA